jgi:hypothetical protein
MSAARAATKSVDSKATSSVLIFALVALPLPYVLAFDHDHSASAMVLALVLCALALRSPRGAAVATLAYLIVLGDYRRYAGFLQGYTADDPLLLVAPVAAFCIVCIAFLDRRLRGGSALAGMVVALTLLMVAQIFNPSQGGVTVGLAGALFYIAPLLWYWIGRAYGSGEIVLLVLRRAVVPLAVAAALLGIYQSLYGLLPFEAAWAKVVRYEALYIGEDVARSIGFFNSGAEYTRFLLVACAAILAGWFTERSSQIVLLPILLVALFLASSRGPVVLLLAVTAVVWAVKARHRAAWAPRLVLAGALGLGLLAGSLLFLRQLDLTGRLDVLVAHQVQGLLNPGDASKSTAVGHLYLAFEGVVEGVRSFIGMGLGATTLAATKYGEGMHNSEVDVANMFYSLGVIGGVLYVAIVIAVLTRAVSVWRRGRGPAELSLLAVVLATVTAWMLGGEYAIAALAWFVIGAIDRAGLAPRKKKHVYAYRASHT